MFFRMVYKSGQIFLPFGHKARVWQTHRQTEFSSLDRVCIACSAVKKTTSWWETDLASLNLCISLNLPWVRRRRHQRSTWRGVHSSCFDSSFHTNIIKSNQIYLWHKNTDTKEI